MHTLGVTAVGLWVLLLHYVMSRNIGQLRGKEEKKKKKVCFLCFSGSYDSGCLHPRAEVWLDVRVSGPAAVSPDEERRRDGSLG